MNSPPDVSRRRHLLTIVLEDYCHVGPVSQVVPPDYWHRFESRVQRNTERTLDLLDETGAKATFFVLGWIAEHQPEVVAEVVRRGHEVASKGFWHRSIGQMSPEEFRADVRRAKEVTEAATGQAVRGFRIPRGGFGPQDLWALDILSEEGYAYDSSVRPIGTAFLDEPFRRFVHRHEHAGHSIWEVPLTTWKLGPLCLPISGGNYVRQLPHSFIRGALDSWERQFHDPIVFYFHVWELDPEQPRITAVSQLQRIRQYRNLDAMVRRIRYYLDKYDFGTVADHLRLGPAASVAPVPRAITPVSQPSPAGPRIPITVVVPCYNEEATLGYTANTLRAFSKGMADLYDVFFLFVDDGSQDRTWERLNELFADRADCGLLRHLKNRGVAATVLSGLRNAQTDIVCVIDCDGTYDPLQLRRMIPMLQPGIDMVTASPYHPDGKVLNLPPQRLVLSKGLSMLYRFVHRHKLYTYTSCFRVYRRRSMEAMVLRDERFVGVTELLSQIDRAGGRIAECPAVMEVRLLGSSKMKTLKTIFGHLGHLGRLIAERAMSLLIRHQNNMTDLVATTQPSAKVRKGEAQ
jgi:polysaccharide deacetylase family protein (PEP-CTERM system associated)